MWHWPLPYGSTSAIRASAHRQGPSRTNAPLEAPHASQIASERPVDTDNQAASTPRYRRVEAATGAIRNTPERQIGAEDFIERKASRHRGKTDIPEHLVCGGSPTRAAVCPFLHALRSTSKRFLFEQVLPSSTRSPAGPEIARASLRAMAAHSTHPPQPTNRTQKVCKWGPEVQVSSLLSLDTSSSPALSA